MANKTIYLLSDGTGNSAASSHRSNVWRFYQALTLGENSDQLAFYDDGVGTSRFPFTRALGGAFGVGLSQNVQELYAALCLHYCPGDRIVLVGFSRGAYTVRLLAALICKLGIVPLADSEHMRAAELAAPDRWSHLPADRIGRARVIAREAWRTYRYRSHWREEDRPAGAWPKGPIMSLVFSHNTQARFRARYLAHAPASYQTPDVNFLGVWDTVAAYGLPIDELALAVNRLITPLRFGDHDINPRVLCARQALALDEARQTFKPLLWNEQSATPHPNVKQVWFAGVHADLGGGYPDDALANQALLWMIEECIESTREQSHVAKFKADALETIRGVARFDGPLHDSRRGFAALYRYKPRNIHALSQQSVDDSVDLVTVKTESIVIHPSAVKRLLTFHDGYAPAALVKPWGHPFADHRPLHMDSPGLAVRQGDLYDAIRLHTKARQRIQENIVLRRISHNISVIALSVFWIYALLALTVHWCEVPAGHSVTESFQLMIVSCAVFFASQLWAGSLRKRGQVLADLVLASSRAETERVVEVAEAGVFKPTPSERLAMALISLSPARKPYVRFVNYWLPWVLLVLITLLLAWPVATYMYRAKPTSYDSGARSVQSPKHCAAAQSFNSATLATIALDQTNPRE